MVAAGTAALLLLSVAGAGSAGDVDAPLGALCAWKSGAAPAALSDWHGSSQARTLADGTRQRNITFSNGGTEATVQQRVFATPPSTETPLRFRHAASTAHPRSAALSEINTLDITLPVPLGAVATLHGFLGSSDSATDYSATEQRLVAGAASTVRQPAGDHGFRGARVLCLVNYTGPDVLRCLHSLLRILIELAAFSVLFSVEKAAIQFQFATLHSYLRLLLL